LLTKEQILKADDRPKEEVLVPEWGGNVLVRSLTAGERDRFEASCLQGSKDNFRSHLAALCIVDEGGKRIFADEDIKALSAKSGAALDRIFRACIRLNAMTADDVAELEGDLKKTG